MGTTRLPVAGDPSVVAGWRRGATVAAALLAVATVLFVGGSFAESDGHRHAEHGGGARESVTVESSGHDETAEAAEGSESRPIGVDAEQPGLIVVAGAISLAVVAALLRRPSITVLAVAGLIGSGFAVLEIAESFHQFEERRWGLLVVAVGALLAHAATVVVCAATSSGVRRARR